MELILITSILTLTNIVSFGTVTGTLPQVDGPAYSQPSQVAQGDSGKSDSLLDAVLKFNKERS